MNSLKQYIDLFRDNREAIESRSSAVMNAARDSALALLGKSGMSLPRRGDEGFERTSIDEMMAPDMGVNINRVAMPVDVAASFRCAVPHMSTLMGVTVNDMFYPVGQLESKLPEGVTFMSLSRAAREFPECVAGIYSKIAPADNPSVALNTLLVQDGVFIRVAPGVKVEKPLQLVNIFSAPTPLLSLRRVLVSVGRGASLALLVCDHTQDSANSYVASQVVEIDMESDATLALCDIEESSPLTSRYNQVWVKQGPGSRLNHATVTLTCGVTRNDINVDLNGEGAETFLAGMAIADREMHIDNNTSVNHRSGRCQSNQLFKYVLEDNADGAFEGSILVAPGAKFTEAYQSNRNILASKTARMHTKPQLEIYNDDVKCSHGATTGQLDENALFYMQARGIPRDEARTMLMQAFMVDVIDTVAIEGLRDRLRHLVENRFCRDGATQGQCSDCVNSCRQ